MPPKNVHRLRAAVIVHRLRAGVTLCLMPGVPRDWPDGHKWVGKEDEKSVTCNACLEVLKLGTAGEPTFELLEEGLAIKCRRCGLISRNPDDVKNFYCGQCHVFHDDIYPPAREAWRKEPEQKTRLQVALSMLDYCASIFRAYEDAHRAKGTPEGTVKAHANMRIAEQVEALVKRLNEP